MFLQLVTEYTFDAEDIVAEFPAEWESYKARPGATPEGFVEFLIETYGPGHVVDSLNEDYVDFTDYHLV